MEILVIIINAELNLNFLMYFQGGTIGAIVFCIVTVKFHWRTNGTVVKCIMMSTTLSACKVFPAILHLAGLQYKCSEQTIQSRKRENWVRKEWVYIKKFKRACRPFSIGDSRQYIVRLRSVLMFFKSASQCKSIDLLQKLLCGFVELSSDLILKKLVIIELMEMASLYDQIFRVNFILDNLP